MIEIKRRYTGVVLLTVDADTLRGAYLHKADLRGADLREAYLRKADLSEADLSEAKLIQTNFCRATIDGARVQPQDIGGPGHILCALTYKEWQAVQDMREG